MQDVLFFLTGFFHQAWWFSFSSMFLCVLIISFFFFLMSSIPLCGHTPFCSYSHQWMNIQVVSSLGRLKEKSAMYILVQVLVWTFAFISLGKMSRSEVAGFYGRLMLNFKKWLNCFQNWLHHFTFLPTVYERSSC